MNRKDTDQSWRDVTVPAKDRAEALLAAMSVDEKIAIGLGEFDQVARHLPVTVVSSACFPAPAARFPKAERYMPNRSRTACRCARRHATVWPPASAWLHEAYATAASVEPVREKVVIRT